MSRIQIETPDDRWVRGDWEGVIPKNESKCVVTKLSGPGEKPECKVMIARYNAEYDWFLNLFRNESWNRKDVSFWQPIAPDIEVLPGEEEQANVLEAELNNHCIDKDFALSILTDPDFGKLWDKPLGKNFRKAIVDALSPEKGGLNDTEGSD